MTTSKTFYKYRAFDLTALQDICRDQLYFSHPRLFNDPFDSRPTLECDLELPELRELLERLVKRRVSAEVSEALSQARLQDERAKAYAAKEAAVQARRVLAEAAYHATNPDYEEGPESAEKWLLTQDIAGELLQHYERGVCCFSTDFDNPLLWSHYAKQHQGICIGYTTDRLPKPALQQVAYGGMRSIKTSLVADVFCRAVPGSEEVLDSSVLLCKAQEWCYESEWRLIGRVGLVDSPLLMTEIIFGLRCPEPVKHAVVQALSGRRKPVAFYEMNESYAKYALVRGELNTDELSAYLPRVAESGVEMFGPPTEDGGA
jgi:Protein of unknown function (DUF2971)